MAPVRKPELSFEEALTQLEQTITALETGQLSLDVALDQYEQGIELARHCTERLDTAELRVKQLVADEQGEAMLIPLED